jgi:lipoyl-dependent peroxiredoxin
MSVDVKYRTTATAHGGRDGTARTEDGTFEVKPRNNVDVRLSVV